MEKKIETLDEWVEHINRIFERENNERTYKDIIIFFIENLGRCFQLINKQESEKIKDMLPILFKWFCILYYKNENHSNKKLSDILWNKFPNKCPYCEKNTCICKRVKKQIDIKSVRELANTTRDIKPLSINDWQNHFQKIYPRTEESDIRFNISRLAEEIAELCEAFRKRHVKREIPCIDMEFADIFSWIIGLANLIDNTAKDSIGYNFQSIIEKMYSNGCPLCEEERNKFNIDYCICAIKPQKLKIISDYNNEEVEQQKLINPINKTEIKLK